MSTMLSIAFSQHPDPQEAVLQACVQIKNQLNRPTTDLVVVFASPEYVVPELQPTITRTLKPKHLAGSSAGGIILSNGVANRGIALIGINSTDMSFGVSAIGNVDKRDMYLTGFDLAYRAAQDLYELHHRKGFLIFSQGIDKNFTQFIRGVKESLGKSFPALGAISSDHFEYTKLSQFFQDQVLNNAAVGLMLGGSLELGVGCAHGFKPLGKPRTATKVDGPIIHTIDEKPAVEIYRHYLGPEAETLAHMPLNSCAALYPLGIRLAEPRQYLLRQPIDILQDGSIVCHEGIPQGAQVHLMMSNIDSCLDSAVEAAKRAKISIGEKQAQLIFVFESLARHKVLGRNAFREIQAIRDIIGPATPIIGMCSYGEIGPVGTSNDIRNIYLQNENILILTIS
ncbi:MAG: FIST C-terminal domain-containing protein [Candidatus Omnitrophica bacterium]|nr:FIST C-terminal domain-containing protein [Candidatus Omnitrophota bacterium]